MPKIVIENMNNRILVAEDGQKSLLQHFHDHRLDWMHACGGKGRCTTCKVIVKTGLEQLAPLTMAESRYRSQGALKSNERLSCQITITDDVVIRAPEEYKLPHVSYSS